jgi:hypothetical protein
MIPDLCGPAVQFREDVEFGGPDAACHFRFFSTFTFLSLPIVSHRLTCRTCAQVSDRHQHAGGALQFCALGLGLNSSMHAVTRLL